MLTTKIITVTVLRNKRALPCDFGSTIPKSYLRPATATTVATTEVKSVYTPISVGEYSLEIKGAVTSASSCAITVPDSSVDTCFAVGLFLIKSRMRLSISTISIHYEE